MNKFKNVSLLVVGGLAIHMVLIACSSGVGALGTFKDATTGNTPGLDSAHAQESAAKCTQWEVKTVTAPAMSRSSIAWSDSNGKPIDMSEGVFGALAVDSGWEPLSSYGFSNNAILLRRCVK